MIKLTRRQLAEYAVDEMVRGTPLKNLSANLAAALAVQRKKNELQLLLADIDRELEDRGLLARARVTSAYPLSYNLLEMLSSQVKKLAQVETVEILTRLDKQVLGGIRIETANHAWDKTVKKQLDSIREAV